MKMIGYVYTTYTIRTYTCACAYGDEDLFTVSGNYCTVYYLCVSSILSIPNDEENCVAYLNRTFFFYKFIYFYKYMFKLNAETAN